MTAVDWDDYQKCPVCFAPLATPCKALTAVAAPDSGVTASDVERARPHTRRPLRKGRG